ncbi:ImmA/IrrE family metallo-endopeptidase [Nocardia sp. NRRL S-836]|uniref:ImmA/IrrE family metallo-endopeptidase n=1 Tax=Nocardia sp. NRRL S-836 TaxID=1519492 RepID=UPI0018D09D60|nr:XRE family transcriptional regulator [Nocardia sp. NRRL S-836]
MLVLARESRGWRQGDVAKEMKALDGGDDSKISQAYVSRAESGKLTVSGDRLDLYASALGYPVELLALDEAEVGAGPGLVHHRKKQAVGAAELRRIHAVLNLTRVQLRGLLGDSPRVADLKIPHITVDDYTSPEDAARAVRNEWALPRGPLDSVVTTLEAAGGWVFSRLLIAPAALDSGNESVPVDAVSSCPPGEDPIVLLNEGTPGDRQRFTLAHELGHMVMHPVPHPDQEKQANRFAAEFLMPANDIRQALTGTIDLSRLLVLKEQWRVSMWALLRRAHTLSAISDWQYRTLTVEMSSLGYRTAEPLKLDAEKPGAVRAAVERQLSQGHDVESLAQASLLRIDEFTQLFLDPNTAGAPEPPHSTPSAEVTS